MEAILMRVSDSLVAILLVGFITGYAVPSLARRGWQSLYWAYRVWEGKKGRAARQEQLRAHQEQLRAHVATLEAQPPIERTIRLVHLPHKILTTCTEDGSVSTEHTIPDGYVLRSVLGVGGSTLNGDGMIGVGGITLVLESVEQRRHGGMLFPDLDPKVTCRPLDLEDNYYGSPYTAS